MTTETESLTGSKGSPTGPPQLKKGAISYISNIVIGVASTAPAYSLAATIGFFVLITGVGVHSPAIIIVSFVPLFFIATAYKAMNEVDPDCGTTFSWVTRAINPSLGLLIGWTVIFSDIVVNANQAQIAGSYGFQLFGLDGAAANKWAVMILGVVFIILLTWICWRGIELSARTQQILLGFEMTLLVVFSVVALIKAYSGSNPASMHVQLGWFNPFNMSFSALLDGVLLGVFLYWGWDTGVSVNEESENSNDGPGKSAVVSTFVLIGIYLLVTVASQAYAGTEYLANNPDDIFAGGLSQGVLGPLHFLLTISVLTSATAATQTTILPAARQALSMGRRDALPRRFAEIHPKNLIPARATIWAGVLSVIWFVVDQHPLEQRARRLRGGPRVPGLHLLRVHRVRVHDLLPLRDVQVGAQLRQPALMPTLGGLALMGVLGYGVDFYGKAANDSSPPLLGLGVPDWILILGVGGGIILVIVRRFQAPAFFREPRQKYGDKIETVTREDEFAPADSML